MMFALNSLSSDLGAQEKLPVLAPAAASTTAFHHHLDVYGAEVQNTLSTQHPCAFPSFQNPDPVQGSSSSR